VTRQEDDEIDPQLDGVKILQRGVGVMTHAILEDVVLQDEEKEATRLVTDAGEAAPIPTQIVMTERVPVVTLVGEAAEKKMIWLRL